MREEIGWLEHARHTGMDRGQWMAEYDRNEMFTSRRSREVPNIINIRGGAGRPVGVVDH